MLKEHVGEYLEGTKESWFILNSDFALNRFVLKVWEDMLYSNSEALVKGDLSSCTSSSSEARQ